MLDSTLSAESRSDNMVPVIQLSNISKTFGGVRALINIDFEVTPGEVHCLAGENGCGKSTLIKIISGVYTPDPGANFTLMGQEHKTLSPAQARRIGVGVIWQDHALFPEMSVAENIAIESFVSLKSKLVRHKNIKDVAQKVCERLGVSFDLDAQVKTLPIAQKQLIAICRVLVSDARIVFMDEPTASLTQSETKHLLDVVRTLTAENVAVVFVSHRLAEVLEIADRVTVLRDGKKVGVYDASEMTLAKLTEKMTGLTINPAVVGQNLTKNETVLEVKQISRTGEYKDISFSIARGEVVGITGLLGAGRTELALSLFGMTRPEQGQIYLDGKAVKFKSNLEAISSGVAYVSEDRLSLGLIQDQSIENNLISTVLDKTIVCGGLLSFKKKKAIVGHWIKELSVKLGNTSDAISTLSGGNQQKVAIAKWLATKPKLLILDAPTVGVDIGAREGIFKIVRDLASKGLSILLISDEVSEVYFNSNRVLHMSNGCIQKEYVPARCNISELEDAIYGKNI